MIDDRYLEFCETEHQLEVLRLRMEGHSINEIARLRDTTTRNINFIIKRIKQNAERRGFSPNHDLSHPTPSTQILKGASTLYDESGAMRMQWVKTAVDTEAIKTRVADLIEEMVQGIKPLPVTKRVTAHPNDDLCTLYTFTDYHLGALAYGKETGADWDLRIAEETFFACFQQMMTGSPDSSVGILNLQGDWLHFDGLDAVTPTNKYPLDADTRYSKLVELSLRIAMDAVAAMLEKHKRIHVIVCEGNHDLASSVWMRKALKQLFRKNPRVEINDSETPFYVYQHGRIMLGFHHGHKVKNRSLPALFSSEPRFREIWGQCDYTYIHTGHYHHAEQDMAEAGGAIVERHPTLAAPDSHAARGGYVSWRAARAITYHKARGEYMRTTVVPEVMDDQSAA